MAQVAYSMSRGRSWERASSGLRAGFERDEAEDSRFGEAGIEGGELKPFVEAVAGPVGEFDRDFAVAGEFGGFWQSAVPPVPDKGFDQLAHGHQSATPSEVTTEDRAVADFGIDGGVVVARDAPQAETETVHGFGSFDVSADFAEAVGIDHSDEGAGLLKGEEAPESAGAVADGGRFHEADAPAEFEEIGDQEIEVAGEVTDKFHLGVAFHHL